MGSCLSRKKYHTDIIVGKDDQWTPVIIPLDDGPSGGTLAAPSNRRTVEVGKRSVQSSQDTILSKFSLKSWKRNKFRAGEIDPIDAQHAIRKSLGEYANRKKYEARDFKAKAKRRRRVKRRSLCYYLLCCCLCCPCFHRCCSCCCCCRREDPVPEIQVDAGTVANISIRTNSPPKKT